MPVEWTFLRDVSPLVLIIFVVWQIAHQIIIYRRKNLEESTKVTLATVELEKQTEITQGKNTSDLLIIFREFMGYQKDSLKIQTDTYVSMTGVEALIGGLAKEFILYLDAIPKLEQIAEISANSRNLAVAAVAGLLRDTESNIEKLLDKQKTEIVAILSAVIITELNKLLDNENTIVK